MIQVSLSDKNRRIITVMSPGKTVLNCSSNSLFFYSPMELLICSLGSCIGTEIYTFSHLNSLDPKIFESINLDIDNFVVTVIIQRPNDFDPNLQEELKTHISKCQIAKMLNVELRVWFTDNLTPTSILTSPSKKGCCGG